MRRLLVAAALLASAAPAAAVEPYVVLLDWQEGTALVGTTPLVPSPLAAAYAFDAGACHRTLLVDLLYEPAETGADVEGVGELALLHEFMVEAWRGGERVAQARVRQPGYGTPLGEIGDVGAHELRVWLATGAAVSYDVRLRARAVPGEPACLPPVRIEEVEANPAGADAGAEWVELHNPGLETLDLGRWTITTTHGVTRTWTLPVDAQLPAGGRLVVAFADGQFLDNADESVVLTDAFGQERDRSPVLSDAADDARSWQWSPDGWSFLAASPGEPKP